MKVRKPGEPNDDGYYQLQRDAVIKVLDENGVTINKINNNLGLFLLESGDEFICEILPPMIPASMVFSLANCFSIQPDKFYTNNDPSH